MRGCQAEMRSMEPITDYPTVQWAAAIDLLSYSTAHPALLKLEDNKDANVERVLAAELQLSKSVFL